MKPGVEKVQVTGIVLTSKEGEEAEKSEKGWGHTPAAKKQRQKLQGPRQTKFSI